eukprot:SAG31_NODE_96_length_25743_cov_56.175948_3_plen_518_part_00
MRAKRANKKIIIISHYSFLIPAVRVRYARLYGRHHQCTLIAVRVCAMVCAPMIRLVVAWTLLLAPQQGLSDIATGQERLAVAAHAARAADFFDDEAGLLGCRNDTGCAVAGGAAWQCVEVTDGGSVCHVNGQQQQLANRSRPAWSWPAARCACRASSCRRPGPPSPPKGRGSFACRAGRCIEVTDGGLTNSSRSCAWTTGCVGLEQHEWLAASFEWQISGTLLTCDHAKTFLKKSELSSTVLPPAQKLAVKRGTVVNLTAPPKRIHGTDYWLISCAVGSICGQSAPENVRSQPRGSLPTYLMIGDSISLGYLNGVQTALAGKFTVIHSTGNAGNANKIAHDLDCFLGQVCCTPFFDYIVFLCPALVRLYCFQVPNGGRPSVVSYNAGIHDLAAGQEWLSPLLYSEMMRNITRRLVATRARVLLVTTTPVPTTAGDPTLPACPEGILDSEVIEYNSRAVAIAKAAGASIVDLYQVVTNICGKGYTSCPIQEHNNPHFLDPGWKLLAKAVSTAVETIAV